MRKLGKLLFIAFRSLIILIIVGFVLTATTKNIQTDILISSFKAKAVFQEDISTSTEKFYIVESDEEPGFTSNWGRTYPGAPGDIIVTKEAIVGGPLTQGFVTFMVGGHAAFCLDKYYDYFLNKDLLPDSDRILEATGMDPSDNASIVSSKDYLSTSYVYNEIIGLRVKMTPEQKKEIQSVMCSYIGDPYNYSFLFNTQNASYCSDIISKGFDQIGVNLNKDGFITSIYDLIVTNETYISYYHYFQDGVKYVYYIG